MPGIGLFHQQVSTPNLVGIVYVVGKEKINRQGGKQSTILVFWAFNSLCLEKEALGYSSWLDISRVAMQLATVN